MAHKYQLVANKIREEVKSGKFGSIGGLPGIGTLATQYHVTNNTIKQALAVLEGERLIIVQSSGYYVNNLTFDREEQE